MTAITLTAATVLSGGKTGTMISQVAIDAGELIFEDSANGNKANLADWDAEASAIVKGLALNNTAAGQPVTYAKPGSIITDSSAPFAVGAVYILENSGLMAPEADGTTDKFITVVGIGLTTSTLLFDIVVSGIEHV